MNAKTFGVKADGVTDDTAALQAAINTAGALGYELQFPAGIMVITKPLVGCVAPNIAGSVSTGVRIHGSTTTNDQVGSTLLYNGNDAAVRYTMVASLPAGSVSKTGTTVTVTYNGLLSIGHGLTAGTVMRMDPSPADSARFRQGNTNPPTGIVVIDSSHFSYTETATTNGTNSAPILLSYGVCPALGPPASGNNLCYNERMDNVIIVMNSPDASGSGIEVCGSQQFFFKEVSVDGTLSNPLGNGIKFIGSSEGYLDECTFTSTLGEALNIIMQNGIALTGANSGEIWVRGGLIFAALNAIYLNGAEDVVRVSDAFIEGTGVGVFIEDTFPSSTLNLISIDHNRFSLGSGPFNTFNVLKISNTHNNLLTVNNVHVDQNEVAAPNTLTGLAYSGIVASGQLSRTGSSVAATCNAANCNAGLAVGNIIFVGPSPDPNANPDVKFPPGFKTVASLTGTTQFSYTDILCCTTTGTGCDASCGGCATAATCNNGTSSQAYLFSFPSYPIVYTSNDASFASNSVINLKISENNFQAYGQGIAACAYPQTFGNNSCTVRLWDNILSQGSSTVTRATETVVTSVNKSIGGGATPGFVFNTHTPVGGIAVLSAGTATVTLPDFFNTGFGQFCLCTDITSNAFCKPNVSGVTLTLTGNSADTIAYWCF